MLGSLRFRLPALFLVGIVVSGVIAAAVALALFQNYARQQLLTKLSREANGLRPLFERLGLALIGGIVAAGGLGWYLSRRITRPVLALSAATDEISRGHYDVDLPEVRGGDEIGHLAQRFREMAARLGDAEQ